MKTISILFLASILIYVFGGIFDFIITTSAYLKYGYLFYTLESNQFIIWQFKQGFPPMQMIILPLIILILGIIGIMTLEKLENLSKQTIYLFIICMLSLILIGFAHFNGGITWIYYGWI